MPEFYYQIKGKVGDTDNVIGFYGGASTWVFPPIFSGKVKAKDKKEAKLFIEEEYGREFPLRVLKKDLDSNEFLLSISPMKPHQKKLFKNLKCEQCNTSFRIIDKYNDANCTDNSHYYCGQECKNEAYEARRARQNTEFNMSGTHLPVIYKITNRINGKSYIGKTNQAFTLRWYQHFFQGGNTKFHKEIQNSSLLDWSFEVIEEVKVPKKYKTRDEVEKYIIKRERHYMKKFNTIEEGYNSKI